MGNIIRYLSLFAFDGDIRQAASRTECAIGTKRLGRAGIDTFAAVATMVFHRLVVEIHVGSNDKFAKEEHGASMRNDELMASALPPNASFLSPIALEDGSSVYAYSKLLFLRFLDAFIIVEPKVLSQSVELFAYYIMIVETIGICRHLRLTIGHRSFWSIVHSHRDYDFCTIEKQARVEANVGMVCHVFHVGIVAFSNPSVKTSFFRFVYTLSLCYATCKKAETFGLGFYDVIIQKS